MIKRMPVADLRENPNNPRTIKDDKFRKLVQSVKEFPEMLEARPIVCTADGVVLGGNMRLKALRQAGIKDVPVYVVKWAENKQSEFLIKDNVGFGEWDWDILANEWETELLDEWGINVPLWDLNEPDDQKKDSTEYDFENFDNSGFTTIKIVLEDDKAKELIDRIDLMKGEKNLSEFVYEYFCN